MLIKSIHKECLLVSLILFFVSLILFSFLIFYIFNSYDPYIIMHSTKKKFTFQGCFSNLLMNVDIVNYRAMIGLFNIVKLTHGKTSHINMAETLLCTLMHIHTCVTVLTI